MVGVAGEVSERLKERDWKSRKRVTVSGVRIPPSPLTVCVCSVRTACEAKRVAGGLGKVGGDSGGGRGLGIPDLRDMGIVAIGAALGGVLRFVVAGAATSLFVRGAAEAAAPGATLWGAMPWGTLVVNVTGCLIIGAIVPLLPGVDDPRGAWRLLIVVGILGGYTTLSAFAMETYRLIRADQAGVAALYMLFTNAGAMIAITLGVLIGRAIARGG